MWPIAAENASVDYDPYAALKKGKYDYTKTILPSLAGMVSGAALSAMKGNSPRQATINAMLGGVGGGAGAFGDELGRQTTYNKELAALINQNLWKQKEFGLKEAQYNIDKPYKEARALKYQTEAANIGKPKSGKPTTQDDIDKARAKKLEFMQKRFGMTAAQYPEVEEALSGEEDLWREREKDLQRKKDGKKPPFWERRDRDLKNKAGAGALQSTQLELPATIQTTSQAVKYLGGRHGMDQNTAVQWLRKNYGQD